ncbi:MAG TPA: hypothetical protein VGH73_25685 [Thermoanaerobaculia bacterium]|jgi:hypothetical protein
MPEDHPDAQLLERFMRNAVDAPERRRVVRHLLAGCARCGTVTRRLWNLGEAGTNVEMDLGMENGMDGMDGMEEPLDQTAADGREPDPEELRSRAAAYHRQAVEIVEAGRAAEALPPLQRARRLYQKLGDGPNLYRLRRLEGRIGEALGASGEAETAFADARQGFILEGLGGEAAEALLDLAILYARQGRTAEIRVLGENLLPILRTRDLRQGVGAALLFFQRLAETGYATLEALTEISRYVAPEVETRR